MSQKHPHPLNRPAIRRRSIVFSLIMLAIVALAFTVYFYAYPAATPENTDQESKHHGRKHAHAGNGSGRDEEDKPVVVAVATAVQADFPVYVNGLGTVTALKTVTVHSRVDGELIKVAFTEGQLVKQGDLLAEIDPRPFEILRQQAEGQLIRDEALLKNAEIDKQRYDALLAQDSIASQQTVTQQALVKQYQGTVEIDKSQLNNAKLQLAYSRLISPISGRIGLRQIDQGNIIHASDSNGLAVITQLQPINVVFSLPEDKVQALIRRWHSHDAISVEAYDRAGKNLLTTGKLTAIDNQIDPTTGTLKLKAQFENNEGVLFANQFVNIKMHLDTLAAVTLIPGAAIQHDTQGAFVYVASQQNSVQTRRITLAAGETADGKVAVLSNLAANELVVVDGTDRLKDGMQIDIAQKDNQPIAASPEGSPKSERKLDAKSPQRDRRS